MSCLLEAAWNHETTLGDVRQQFLVLTFVEQLEREGAKSCFAGGHLLESFRKPRLRPSDIVVWFFHGWQNDIARICWRRREGACLAWHVWQRQDPDKLVSFRRGRPELFGLIKVKANYQFETSDSCTVTVTYNCLNSCIHSGVHGYSAFGLCAHAPGHWAVNKVCHL